MRRMPSGSWIVVVVVVASILAGACGGRPAPKPTATDEVIVQLEAELREAPDNGAVIYALAMLHDRLRHVDEAVRWLDRLATTPWDGGIDPADFGTLRAEAADRYDAARLAIERRWTAVPTARELVRVAERDLLPEGMERLADAG